jgi:hypothetical protein
MVRSANPAKRKLSIWNCPYSSLPKWVKLNLTGAFVCVLLGLYMVVEALFDIAAGGKPNLFFIKLIEASTPLGIGLCWWTIAFNVWRRRETRSRWVWPKIRGTDEFGTDQARFSVSGCC